MILSKILPFIFKQKLTTRDASVLSTFPEKLDTDKIKISNKTHSIGQEILYFTKIDSTNTKAKELADKGAKEGTLVIAEEQLKGRGRLNRHWISAPYKNILMSLVFRPALPTSRIYLLTMSASIAIVNAIKKTTGLRTLIKWPNDIYYKNKKLAGLLTELHIDKNNIKYAVMGIGLNVNFDPALYPEITGIATSLYKECGRIISREKLLKRILLEMAKEYYLLLKGDANKIRKSWNKHSLVTGKSVIISSGKYSEEGIAGPVAEDGSLTLIKSNGEIKNIFCGDVSLRVKHPL
jgi:BirA family transcriptional regulator, biotin operon repressor / biotin---[acetyl-CoA-carboxylase] ligase